MKKMHIGKPMNLTVALLVSGFAVKETPFSHSFPEGNSISTTGRSMRGRSVRTPCCGAVRRSFLSRTRYDIMSGNCL